MQADLNLKMLIFSVQAPRYQWGLLQPCPVLDSSDFGLKRRKSKVQAVGLLFSSIQNPKSKIQNSLQSSFSNRQCFDPPARFVQFVVGLGVTEANQVVSVGPVIERFARHGSDPRPGEEMHGLLLAGGARQPGSIGEDVVRALRRARSQSRTIEGAAEPVALGRVVLGETLIELGREIAKALRRAPLQGRRRANVNDVAHVTDHLRPPLVACRVADSPA